MIESVRKKLVAWKAKLLSFGAQIVLIKSVLSSLSSFYFSLFKAPNQVIKKLVYLQRNFLWGSEERKKTPWVAWHQVCRDNDKGGLGIKSLKELNIAMLGKWRWKLLRNEEKLGSRVIFSLYGYMGKGDETGLE